MLKGRANEQCSFGVPKGSCTFSLVNSRQKVLSAASKASPRIISVLCGWVYQTCDMVLPCPPNLLAAPRHFMTHCGNDLAAHPWAPARFAHTHPSESKGVTTSAMFFPMASNSLFLASIFSISAWLPKILPGRTIFGREHSDLKLLSVLKRLEFQYVERTGR